MQRPLREYEAEPDLARAVKEALAREAAGQAGKPLLHLVVLGHVDAGKSTLMGRLLHDLGCGARCSLCAAPLQPLVLPSLIAQDKSSTQGSAALIPCTQQAGKLFGVEFFLAPAP